MCCNCSHHTIIHFIHKMDTSRSSQRNELCIFSEFQESCHCHMWLLYTHSCNQPKKKKNPLLPPPVNLQRTPSDFLVILWPFHIPSTTCRRRIGAVNWRDSFSSVEYSFRCCFFFFFSSNCLRLGVFILFVCICNDK